MSNVKHYGVLFGKIKQVAKRMNLRSNEKKSQK